MSARLRALAAAALSAGLLVGTGLPSQASAPAAGAASTGSGPAAAAPRTVAPRSVAPRSAPSDGTLRVATYNVCKKACGKGRFSWANRRVALVNAVRAADPDVLAVQEANTQLWQGVRHIDDVQQLLGSVGLQIASTDYESCTLGCTRGAHIFYDPSRVRIASLPNPSVAVGMTGLSMIAQTGFGGIQDRAVSWAFLSPHGSSRATLFVSVHLPTEKNAEGERLRVAVASQLRPWADSLIRASGLSGAELVIAGDFNSFNRRQPYGAQRIVADSGLIDGFAAPEKVNANFGTVNYTPATKKYKGFPPRPWFYRTTEPARIDYVFSTAAPLRHEVVVVLTPTGEFDDAYRASDHNMVMVDLPLR
jgi:endonuclease/exonuclease/phosphatase family metal-dependent hydrolase